MKTKKRTVAALLTVKKAGTKSKEQGKNQKGKGGKSSQVSKDGKGSKGNKGNKVSKGIMERERSEISREFPRHTYVYCRSRALAERFLRDAEEEGFLFRDNVKPTKKDPDDIYALNSDFTISYTGYAAHMMFGGGGDHVVWIDYGKYICGEKDFQTVERNCRQFFFLR